MYDFEWDETKAQSNVRKHGIDFADAVTAFFDELAITISEDSAEEERRWITIGTDSLERMLVIIYTWRGETVRLISARTATPLERRRYEDKR